MKVELPITDLQLDILGTPLQTEVPRPDAVRPSRTARLSHGELPARRTPRPVLAETEDAGRSQGVDVEWRRTCSRRAAPPATLSAAHGPGSRATFRRAV